MRCMVNVNMIYMYLVGYNCGEKIVIVNEQQLDKKCGVCVGKNCDRKSKGKMKN